MGITHEIKAKSLAPYLFQRVVKMNGDTELQLLTLLKITEWFTLNNEYKLVLKPLTLITDEDAIEMAELFGGVHGKILLNRPADLENNDIHFAVQVYTNEPKYTTYCTPKYWTDGYGVKAYQFLQSKGYDLPTYLLDGKTLKESGLAIYE